MPFMRSSSRSLAPMRRAELLVVLFLAFLACVTNTPSFAGEFHRLARAKYVFIGVVTEAKAMAKPSMEEVEGPRGSVEEIYYPVEALVSPKRNVLTGTPEISTPSQKSLPVCATDITVGATYLFMSNGPEKGHKCFPSTKFLLGALPGKAPESSIVLTEDVLLTLPKSPNLVQRSVVLPDAHLDEGAGMGDVVILKTYLDLEYFVDLLEHERTGAEATRN